MVNFKRPTVGPWWGKLGGVVGGSLVLGWPGGVGGFVVGTFLDRGLQLRRYAPGRWTAGQRSRVQRIFLISTFAVSGHIAKADGRVSEREIEMARAFMGELELSADECRHAIAMFTHGKRPGFPIMRVTGRLRRAAARDPLMLERFLECQLRMVLADGEPSARQRQVLRAVGASLRLPAQTVDRLLSERAAKMRGDSNALTPTLEQAYAMLDVQASASPDEIKRAYRRMIGRHHPDRLEGQGLPQNEIKRAAARTHDIRAAFNRIRRVRGF